MEAENSTIVGEVRFKFLHPLQFIWKPKEDITTYELAMCMPILLGRVITYDVPDCAEAYYRHFEIIDHNKS